MSDIEKIKEILHWWFVEHGFDSKHLQARGEKPIDGATNELQTYIQQENEKYLDEYLHHLASLPMPNFTKAEQEKAVHYLQWANDYAEQYKAEQHKRIKLVKEEL